MTGAERPHAGCAGSLTEARRGVNRETSLKGPERRRIGAIPRTVTVRVAANRGRARYALPFLREMAL